VGQAEFRSSATQELLDLEQNLERDNAADATAVDGQKLLGSGLAEPILQN
jgi:hypothetical protein